jgi:hypothetical protein
MHSQRKVLEKGFRRIVQAHNLHGMTNLFEVETALPDSFDGSPTLRAHATKDMQQSQTCDPESNRGGPVTRDL